MSDAGQGGRIARSATLRDALSVMMSDSMRPLLVVDEHDGPVGSVSIELINKALRRPTTEPTASTT